MTLEVLKGVFREDAWATPLLALSVIVLCALLLYTVLGLCSRIGGGKQSPDPSLNNSSCWTSFDVSWLQMPLILGLMTLASTCIVAAVPLNEAACRILFLGPGIGHVLLAAGLLSRIVQHSIKTHIVLQWLLLFFVILNQVIISAAYLHRSWTTLIPITSNQQRTNTTNAAFKAQANCQLTVHDQLLVMLYPALLVAVVLLLVYRTARRTRSQWKSREAIHAGLAASFAGAFTGCWLGAASVLGDAFLPSCLGYGCLATVIVVALISLIPRSSSEAFAEAAVERIGDTFRRHRIRQPRVRLSPATSSGSTSSEPVGPTVRHSIYGNKDVNHHQLMGRGTEKSLPNDPEIFIVPMAPSEAGARRQVVAVPVSDIAVQAIKAHHHRHHHHRASSRSFQHHQRNHHNRESGRHQHRHYHPPGGVGYQWNGKLMRSNLSASNRRLNKSVRMMRQDVGAGSRSGIMRNVSDRVPSSSCVILEHSEEAANQQQLQLNQNYINNGRTPYNHRGWLY